MPEATKVKEVINKFSVAAGPLVTKDDSIFDGYVKNLQNLLLKDEVSAEDREKKIADLKKVVAKQESEAKTKLLKLITDLDRKIDVLVGNARERSNAISLAEQQKFAKTRQEYSVLAESVAKKMEELYGQVQQQRKGGAATVPNSQKLLQQTQKLYSDFHNHPLFLASRQSMPDFPQGTPEGVEKSIRKTASDAFEVGMRASSRISKAKTNIEASVSEHEAEAEEAMLQNADAKTCVAKIQQIGSELEKYTAQVSKITNFKWEEETARLEKFVVSIENGNPGTVVSFRNAYIGKRNELGERIQSAKSYLGHVTGLLNRMKKIPERDGVKEARIPIIANLRPTIEGAQKAAGSESAYQNLVEKLNQRAGV